MTINFKFKFNDEVYVVLKTPEGDILIYKDIITDVSANEVANEYFTEKCNDAINEEELVLYANKEELINKIDELLSYNEVVE